MDSGKQKSINQIKIDNIRSMEETVEYFKIQLDDINQQIETEKYKTRKLFKILVKLREEKIKQIQYRRKAIKEMQQELIIC